MKPTFLRVGVPKSVTRAPATVRPPTEAGTATLPENFVCTEIDNGSPPYTVNIASGVSGDLGFLNVTVDSTQTATTPTGWTLLDSYSPGSVRTTYMYYRVYDGTETASLSLTTTGAANVLGMAWILSGSIDWSVVTPEISWANAHGGQMNPPSHTPSGGAGQYWVMAGGNANTNYGADTGIAPSGYSQLGDCAVGGDITGDVNYQLVDITTSEDPAAYGDSMSGTRRWYAWTMTVDGAAGDPPVAAGDHTHEAADVDFGTGTDGYVWTSDGAGGEAWEALPSSDHGGLSGLADDDHTQYVLADGTRAFTGDQSMGSNKLTNVTDPTADQDAATKAYVDANVGGELLMQDGVTNPPVPIETEAQDDWLYEG